MSSNRAASSSLLKSCDRVQTMVHNAALSKFDVQMIALK